MAKKKRKRAEKPNGEKKPVGHPKVLPPELDTRFQIRCSKGDETAWDEHAVSLGYTRSQWIRKTLNDAMQAGR